MRPFKYNLFIFIFCGLFKYTSGQDTSDSDKLSSNTFFVEIFGNCGYGSLNYDHIVLDKNSNKISVRFGILPYPKFTSLASGTMELNYLKGIKNHLECSLGLTYIHGLFKEGDSFYTHQASGNLLLFPHVGYRFQKKNGGIFFRAGLGVNLKIVELYTYDKNKFGGGNLEVNNSIWFGIGIGFTLKTKSNV